MKREETDAGMWELLFQPSGILLFHLNVHPAGHYKKKRNLRPALRMNVNEREETRVWPRDKWVLMDEQKRFQMIFNHAFLTCSSRNSSLGQETRVFIWKLVFILFFLYVRAFLLVFSFGPHIRKEKRRENDNFQMTYDFPFFLFCGPALVSFFSLCWCCWTTRKGIGNRMVKMNSFFLLWVSA